MIFLFFPYSSPQLFGFLMLMVLITTLVCAEISVLLTYLQLCREDYRWWWRSFFHTGVYVYIYIYIYIYMYIYTYT